MTVARIEAHRWTRQEYERMGETGLLPEGRRTELLNGVIYDMTPQSSLHATSLIRAARVVERVLPAGCHVRTQGPLVIDPDSMPEPDIAVVRGENDDYQHSHPATALLVVEVAYTSLAYDRKKAAIYARAGIPELWVLDLGHAVLEVHREPRAGSYRSVIQLRPGDTVRPLFTAAAGTAEPIPVADLLPRPPRPAGALGPRPRRIP